MFIAFEDFQFPLLSINNIKDVLLLLIQIKQHIFLVTIFRFYLQQILIYCLEYFRECHVSNILFCQGHR